MKTPQKFIFTDVSFQYDKNGSLTFDGVYRYYYDCENRLTEVNDTGNQRIATYKYDFSGKRVSEIVGSSTTKHCYDGDQVIADYNSSGILQKKYVFGPGIDEPICMLDVNNAVYYYHYDGLGNIVALSSNASRYIAIAAGGYHSLGLKSDGSIVGWGKNDYGQATPPSGNDFVAISAKESLSLALKRNGSIIGWGENNYGQATPPSGNNYIAISAGAIHGLALRSDGSIAAWGNNYYGESSPPSGNNFVAVAAGLTHSLALKNDGSIVGWGDNSYGQRNPPADYNYVAIAGGETESIALKNDGSVVVWGDNWGPPPSPPPVNDFIAVSAQGTSIALRTNSIVWDSIFDQHVGDNYVAISAGGSHNLALKSDGSIDGWDGNGYGQATPQAASKATIVERYSYDVFGKPTIRDVNNSVVSVSSVANRFMFTGREYDVETGNYYYRARYYSPKLGRFLQTDPIRYAGGLNLYTYCGNNPLNWIDPYGLSKFSPWYVTPVNAIGTAAGYISDLLHSPIDIAVRLASIPSRAEQAVQYNNNSVEEALNLEPEKACESRKKAQQMGNEIAADLIKHAPGTTVNPELPGLNPPVGVPLNQIPRVYGWERGAYGYIVKDPWP